MALGTAAAAPAAHAGIPSTGAQSVVAATHARKSKPHTHLQLSVSGAPKARLVVKGRNTRRAVTKSSVLTLRPGRYAVRAAKVSVGGSQYVPAQRVWKVSLRKGRTGLILVNYERVATSSPSTPNKPVTSSSDALPTGELGTMVALVNQARSSTQQCGTETMGPASPLSYDAQLAAAAQRHAQDMSSKDYFDHTALDGSTFVERVARTSYDGDAGGENIAMGYPSAAEVVQGWLASPGHCVNLMDPEFDEVGLGLAFRDDPRYNLPVAYWVQVFGYSPEG